MSAIDSTRIINGSPARYVRSAAADFVVVDHGGCKIFLARHNWLALPEQDKARPAPDKSALRLTSSGRAPAIAALFLALTVLRAVEIAGRLIRRASRRVAALFWPIGTRRSSPQPQPDHQSLEPERPARRA